MTRTIGLIPARGGSKRLPGKNLRQVGGKSLIERAIESALESGLEIAVSTEDRAIAQEAARCGLRLSGCLVRPDDLAADSTEMIDVVLHAADELQLASDDVIVLLQPTSPFRTAETIKRALAAFKGDPVVSVSRVELPEHCYAMREERLSSVEVVTPNGCVYVASVGYLRLYKSFTFMARGLLVEGDEALDIDTRDDWIKARVIAGERLTSDPYGNYLVETTDNTVTFSTTQRIAA